MFDAQKVQALSIFRIREMPGSVFVSNCFVDMVDSNSLQGFEFKKVWPLPKGVNWRKQKDDRENRRGLTQHTLVVVLPLRGTSKELGRIKAFGDVLDGKLQVNSLKSEYLGCYEGDEVVSDECRIFLSCPDVDRLFEYLQSDIKNLRWADTITVYRRYGRLFESEANEEVATFD